MDFMELTAMMRIRLLNAKQKNPNGDYSEQEEILERLNKFYEILSHFYRDWVKACKQRHEYFSTMMEQVELIRELEVKNEKLLENVKL